MIKILFICHGNICRSPMAEFLLKDIVKKRGIAADFEIARQRRAGKKLAIPCITAHAISWRSSALMWQASMQYR